MHDRPNPISAVPELGAAAPASDPREALRLVAGLGDQARQAEGFVFCPRPKLAEQLRAAAAEAAGLLGREAVPTDDARGLAARAAGLMAEFLESAREEDDEAYEYYRFADFPATDMEALAAEFDAAARAAGLRAEDQGFRALDQATSSGPRVSGVPGGPPPAGAEGELAAGSHGGSARPVSPGERSHAG